MDYEEQRKTLIRAGITDFGAIEEQRRLAILEVNKKYDDEEAEDRDEKAQKAADANQKSLELQMQRLAERRDAELAINKQITDSWVALGDNIARTFMGIGQLFKEGSDLQKAFGIISVIVNGAQATAKVIQDSNESMSDLRKQQAHAVASIARGTVNTAFGNPAGVLQLAASKASLATVTGLMAKVRINRALQVGTIAATTAGQVAAILSAKKNSASGGGASGGDTAPQLPAFSQGGSIAAPTLGSSGQSQTGQLAGIVNNAIQRDNSRDRPLRAFVVGNDIKTQEQLDRRIRTAARLS